MSLRRSLKCLHLLGTFWFVLCLIYTTVLILHQAGFNGWVIFSMSGHSAVIITLLLVLYLYAGFQGVSGKHCSAIEHQLTSTSSYMTLYLLAPFIGGLAGLTDTLGIEQPLTQLLMTVALATMMGTFLIWIIIDPATNFLETILVTESRRHRAKRLAQAKIEKQKRQKAGEKLLNEVLSKEQTTQRHWQQLLKPEVDKVVQLFTNPDVEAKKAENQIVEIGVNAWRTGGIICMKTLRDMVIKEYENQNGNKTFIDYISYWWDGIGSWRTLGLEKMPAC